jgi:outer membrane biogenesis lipoprotein LolB
LARAAAITLAVAALLLAACGPDAAARREKERAAAEERSLGSRVRAVGDKAEAAIQAGEQRNREAVDSAE